MNKIRYGAAIIALAACYYTGYKHGGHVERELFQSYIDTGKQLEQLDKDFSALEKKVADKMLKEAQK